jgi:hypothetical protein
VIKFIAWNGILKLTAIKNSFGIILIRDHNLFVR